jgi:hypothetical protein
VDSLPGLTGRAHPASKPPPSHIHQTEFRSHVHVYMYIDTYTYLLHKIPVSYHRRGRLNTFPEAPGFNSTNTDKIRPDLLLLLLLSQLYTATQFSHHQLNSIAQGLESGGHPTACAHNNRIRIKSESPPPPTITPIGKTNASIEPTRDTARHETHPVATTRYRAMLQFLLRNPPIELPRVRRGNCGRRFSPVCTLTDLAGWQSDHISWCAPCHTWPANNNRTGLRGSGVSKDGTG